MKHVHQVVGWRELVGFPELGLRRVKAKIDTGARTTAMHADDIEFGEIGGHPWVEFTPPAPVAKRRAKRVRVPVMEHREIKNTGGEAESRAIIRTRFVIASRTWHIDVSLTDRATMAFPVIVGRTAIRGHRILVNPNVSFNTARRAHSPES